MAVAAMAAVVVTAMVLAPAREVGEIAVMAAVNLRPVLMTTAAAGVVAEALLLRLRVMTTAITAVPKAER
jgi:hypothetical protein